MLLRYYTQLPVFTLGSDILSNSGKFGILSARCSNFDIARIASFVGSPAVNDGVSETGGLVRRAMISSADCFRWSLRVTSRKEI